VIVDGVEVLQLSQTFIDSISNGNVNPTAPTVTVNGRSVSALHPDYPGELESRINSSAWADYVDNTPIAVGENAVQTNYYQWRVKSKPGQNSGAVSGNPFIDAAGSGGTYVDLIDEYVPGDIDVSIVLNDIDFGSAKRARNDKVLSSGQQGALKAIISVAGAFGFGPNDTTFAGRNEMMLGATKEGDNKVTFYSLGANLFESAPILSEPVVEIIANGTDWICIVNGSEVGRIVALSGDHKSHYFGGAEAFVHDIQQYGFE
jgi:hypothetical protein